MSVVGYNGNQLEIRKDGTKIAAVRTKTMNKNRNMVDVTTDDDNGWQRFLERPGTQGYVIDVGGIVTSGNEDDFLAADDQTFWVVTVHTPDGGSYAAADGFALGNITITANHDGAVEFTAQLMSSSVVTHTP